jgi:hypothetical protein
MTHPGSAYQVLFNMTAHHQVKNAGDQANPEKILMADPV